MNVVVNWPTVVMGLIVLGAGLIACGTYCFLESRRIAATDRQQRRKFEQDMKTVELPEYNGATYDMPEAHMPAPDEKAAPPAGYDWTAESLAYLADDQWAAAERTAARYLPRNRPAVEFTYEPYGASAQTAPIPVVPPSTISGPLPVISTTGNDDFMARLRADNAEFLARLDAPAGT